MMEILNCQGTVQVAAAIGFTVGGAFIMWVIMSAMLDNLRQENANLRGANKFKFPPPPPFTEPLEIEEGPFITEYVMGDGKTKYGVHINDVKIGRLGPLSSRRDLRDYKGAIRFSKLEMAQQVVKNHERMKKASTVVSQKIL